MSWRNRLIRPSFRGVTFHLEKHDLAGGRRPVPSEFIKRDEPFTDDLGRRIRHFSVNGYLIGPNFDLEMQTLRTAFETEGAGTLVHPFFGIHQVVCDHFAFEILRDKGGRANFTAEFYEKGSRSPRPVRAIGPLLSGAALELRTGASNFLKSQLF